jgi:serine/threonine protein kinase/regulation of enolase protein 1 (concanavalin A-like superfamily)
MGTVDNGESSTPRDRPEGAAASDDPVATISFTPGTGQPTGGGRQDGSPAASGGFDFLGPPRDAGELGWLAHYRVRKLIGEGGMGLVFLAEDTELSRPVALKVIRPEMAGAAGIAERFTREARATAAIKHDHIVTIYHVGRDRGVPYLAMEYLQGVSLARWLERGRKPSVELILRLGREIADGLAAAHARGLIHRDIKPANIWLEAPSGRVKILDFGQVHAEREDVQITRAGAILGTPAFMAPEQARGEPVGVRSDLFSLGCVLYRLCCGRLPFEGPNVIATLTALASHNPAPPRESNSSLPPALDELVMRLIAKDPAERPASAPVVVEILRRIERQRAAERQQATLSDAKTVPDGLEALLGLEDVPALPRRSEAPAPERNSRPWWIVAAGVGTAAAVVLLLSLVLLSSGGHGRPAAESRSPATITDAGNGPAAPQQTATDQPGSSTGRKSGVSSIQPNAGSAPKGSDGVGSAATTDPTGDRALLGSVEPKRTAQETHDAAVAPSPDAAKAKPPQALQTGSNIAPSPAPARVVWTDPIDPSGDCEVTRDPGSGRMTFVVPGTAHILSAELGQRNAPRVLRGVQGDFVAKVRVAQLTQPAGRATHKKYGPYHGAGLLLWQDEDNYLRLEIASDLRKGKLFSYVNYELRKDGVLAHSSGPKIEDGWNFLRLERRGDQFLASIGPDGAQWTAFPALTAKLETRLKIGALAINTASKPLKAELDGFEVTEPPSPGPGAGGNDSKTAP